MDPFEWPAPGTIPLLTAEQVQVWRLNLAEPEAGRWLDVAALSDSERLRAAKMRVAGARDEFVAGRRLLRTLLGWHLGMAPGNVVFAEGSHGKPCLGEGGNLQFNVSHSRGLVLIAISRSDAVGIDVEYRDPTVTEGGEVVSLAYAGLQPEEAQALQRLTDPAQQARTFYKAWTRKEAVAKADGRGIAEALRYRVMSSADDRMTVWVEAAFGAEVAYLLTSVAAGPNHEAALAGCGSQLSARLLDARSLDPA